MQKNSIQTNASSIKNSEPIVEAFCSMTLRACLLELESDQQTQQRTASLIKSSGYSSADVFFLVSLLAVTQNSSAIFLLRNDIERGRYWYFGSLDAPANNFCLQTTLGRHAAGMVEGGHGPDFASSHCLDGKVDNMADIVASEAD